VFPRLSPSRPGRRTVLAIEMADESHGYSRDSPATIIWPNTPESQWRVSARSCLECSLTAAPLRAANSRRYQRARYQLCWALYPRPGSASPAHLVSWPLPIPSIQLVLRPRRTRPRMGKWRHPAGWPRLTASSAFFSSSHPFSIRPSSQRADASAVRRVLHDVFNDQPTEGRKYRGRVGRSLGLAELSRQPPRGPYCAAPGVSLGPNPTADRDRGRSPAS
jgi:hypothetical protein